MRSPYSLLVEVLVLLVDAAPLPEADDEVTAPLLVEPSLRELAVPLRPEPP